MFLPFKKGVSLVISERCPEVSMSETADANHEYYYGLVTPSGYVINGGKIECDLESFDPFETSVMKTAQGVYSVPKSFLEIKTEDVLLPEDIEGLLDVAKHGLAQKKKDLTRKYHKEFYKKSASEKYEEGKQEIAEVSKELSEHFVKVFKDVLAKQPKSEYEIKTPITSIPINLISQYGLVFKSERDVDGSYYENGMTILSNKQGDKFFAATVDEKDPQMLNISEIENLPGKGKLVCVSFAPAYDGVSRFIATYKPWEKISNESQSEKLDYYGFITPGGYVISTEKAYPTSEREYLYDDPYGSKFLEVVFDDPEFYSVYLENEISKKKIYQTSHEYLAFYDVASYSLKRQRMESGERLVASETKKLEEKIALLTEKAYVVALEKERKKVKPVGQTPVYPPHKVLPEYEQIKQKI